MNYRFSSVKIPKQLGFTLLELLIVIAVIGVLASLAVPRFQNQLQKAKFVEVINTAAPYKTAVELCYQRSNDINLCDSGLEVENNIPASIAIVSASGVVVNASVTDGKITVTGGDIVDKATYVLSPSVVEGQGIDWEQTGGCIAKNLCESTDKAPKQPEPPKELDESAS